MISEVRKKFHKTFASLKIGDRYQLVNKYMGGALPNSIVLEKLDTVYSIRLDNQEKVVVRPYTTVELVPKSESSK